MKYTQEQRLEMVREFRRARDVIAAGHEVYICCAISPRLIPGSPAERLCLDEIRARMDPTKRRGLYYSLENWLTARKVPKSLMTHYTMQEYRLRWLDALIKEFSE